MTVEVATATGGHSINMPTGEFLRTCMTEDTLATDNIGFTITKLGNADADNIPGDKRALKYQSH